MPNPYTSMLPQPPAEDTRAAITALREFAEAIEQYPGTDKDVEVSVSVHPESGPPDYNAEVQMSVYVPKTDYVNIVLVANCTGSNGFPVTVDPYFASGSFAGPITCHDRQQLDATLQQFVKSREVLSLLDYIRRHAQKR